MSVDEALEDAVCLLRDDDGTAAIDRRESIATVLEELRERLDDPEVIVALRRRAEWQTANGGNGAAYRLHILAAALSASGPLGLQAERMEGAE